MGGRRRVVDHRARPWESGCRRLARSVDHGRGAQVWGAGDRDLGAAGTGMTSHQAVGEEAAAVGVVLAGAQSPGCLLGAVRDGAVTVHDQLSGTAPHPSPPHRRGRHAPAERPSDPGVARGGLGPSIGASRRLLEEISQRFPNFLPFSQGPRPALTGSLVRGAGEPTPGRGGRSSPPPRSPPRPPVRADL